MEKVSKGVKEYRSKGVKENYTDTPIRRYTDTEIHRFPDTPVRYKAGFSLMEMMVVVLIIAVMLGVALPHFIGHRGQTSVKVAARDVCSVMRLAHRKAAEARTNYLAVFDLDNETIWVQEGSSYPAKNPVPGTEKKLADEVIIARVTAGTPGQGTGSGNPGGTIDTSIGYYVYSPKGTSQDGYVYLRDTDNKSQYKVRSFTSAQAKIYSSW